MTAEREAIPQITIVPEPSADERDAILAAFLTAAALRPTAAGDAETGLTPWARAARAETLRSAPAPRWGTPLAASRWSER